MISPLVTTETLHDLVEIPLDCGSCRSLITTTDAFGTGDSPTVYDCDATSVHCPVVKAALEAALGEMK